MARPKKRCVISSFDALGADANSASVPQPSPIKVSHWSMSGLAVGIESVEGPEWLHIQVADSVEERVCPLRPAFGEMQRRLLKRVGRRLVLACGSILLILGASDT
jgi:hypothetical protein